MEKCDEKNSKNTKCIQTTIHFNSIEQRKAINAFVKERYGSLSKYVQISISNEMKGNGNINDRIDLLIQKIDQLESRIKLQESYYSNFATLFEKYIELNKSNKENQELKEVEEKIKNIFKRGI